MASYRVIQGCPANVWIAPYIDIIVSDIHGTVNSIYRGQDVAAILHAHGKHTQAELYQMFLNGQGAPANPPGFSTHERKSDGVAYPNVPRGHDLSWWQEGFDLNDNEVIAAIDAAARYGWRLFQPYRSGSEYHHLNFAAKPRPTATTWPRIWRLRASLPRS